MNEGMQLETKISAKFFSNQEVSEQEQQSIEALNKHTEDICESLQPIFQNLIIEMLELKRQAFTQGG